MSSEASQSHASEGSNGLGSADLLRQEVVALSETWVIKVGTRVLTDARGLLDESRIEWLADQIHAVMSTGRRVALVSSGAVGAGLGQLGIPKRPRDLAQLQAIAAVGQCYLVRAYDTALKRRGRHAAQILLTADDINHRTRYLNVRNTLVKLFEFGALPIINENDTVSVSELQTTFGDNDRLAALLTNLLRANLLVILSDVPGLYDRDPIDPAAQLLDTVPVVDDRIFGLVRDRLTGLSKGGMGSKLNAAKLVTAAGGSCIIASGRGENTLRDILAGHKVGTLFLTRGEALASRKRWIGLTVPPQGRLIVDEGARRAVETKGRSLLPIGVREVEGQFQKGDVVSVVCPNGEEFARGLTNYSADETRLILGKRSDGIAETLGHRPYEECVHRDNLVVLSDPNLSRDAVPSADSAES
jgi:glutamate 5-kinase